MIMFFKDWDSLFVRNETIDWFVLWWGGVKDFTQWKKKLEQTCQSQYNEYF